MLFKGTILISDSDSLNVHVCIFIKTELEAAMGDEDWEAEIINPHMSSYVPVFEKVIKFKVCSYCMLQILSELKISVVRKFICGEKHDVLLHVIVINCIIGTDEAF